MVFLFRALKLKVVNFLFIVGSNPPPECSDLIKYPRYEPDTCHCDLIKEELGGEFSQCILDPPKESSGLLRPISTSSYVFFISLYKINSFSFDSHRILCMTFEFWKKKKKKDLQRILITWMCTQWYCSILSEFILSLIYELMLSFLFNFDHLANNLRIHNALCILNALLRAWLSILKKIRWCFLWFDDLNILEINKKSEWDKTCVLVILNVLLFTNNSV